MTLRPFVQLKFGELPITRIPPDRLLQLVYTTSLSRMGSFSVSCIDPTYHELEDMLLLADRDAKIVSMRFGYIYDTIYAVRRWVTGYLTNYVPRITEKGMEIAANFDVMPGLAIATVEPKQFSGRISKVVADIAAVLNMNAEIEETNDDENEAHIDYDNGPRQWFTGNLTLIKFIREKLLPLAKSKSSKSEYILFVTHEEDGQGKPTIHFHSRSYPKCARRSGDAIQVTYFAGQQDQVLEFNPNYDSKQLGSIGIGSMVSRTFDPNKGQIKAQVDNIAVTEIDSDPNEGTSTVGPINEKDPSSINVSQGVVADKDITPQAIENKANSRWSTLHSASYTADLNLVGLPEFVNLEAFDYISMAVMLPYHGGWREHWSGGRWVVAEAVHTIQSAYSIQCQLERRKSNQGNYEL